MITHMDRELRVMQEIAQQLTALQPELVNDDATVGELAWIWGKDHAEFGHTWRRRLWRGSAGQVVGWGWVYLPYEVTRTDGRVLSIPYAYLTWQLVPGYAPLLDDILSWYEELTVGIEHRVTVRAADRDALTRLAAHGYRPDAVQLADDGYWVQLNERDLSDDIEEPRLPSGYVFRTAQEAGPEAAVRAHVDAWHPSTFTAEGFAGVRRTWPYRGDLHVLVEAADGTMVSTAIMWLDEENRTAEFEPVGTHREYRRLGLSSALLRHGMLRARAAGATRMTVTCAGAAGHPAARELYYSVGFKPYTRSVPHIKPALTGTPGSGAPVRNNSGLPVSWLQNMPSDPFITDKSTAASGADLPVLKIREASTSFIAIIVYRMRSMPPCSGMALCGPVSYR
jgi:GNAT superfamily N-acetyltransferase